MLAIGWISDLLLVIAGIYTVARALRARRLEHLALRCDDQTKREQYLEDARTLAVIASLQQTWVLLALAGGFGLKLVQIVVPAGERLANLMGF
ncbi:MAG: hypothetical protein AAFX09_09010 [Pseudomonadota bacterium]